MTPTPDRLPAPPILPAQSTGLVGRAVEVETLRQRLLQEGVRLLTLTGPAGTGKTRLALAVAGAVSVADAADGGGPDGPPYPDGVWFVDLTAVAGPEGALPAMGRALGLRADGSAPTEERLRHFLREKRLLLLLDNAEHVLAAGPAVATLLDACPGLTVLATSREPLRVRWERLFPVPPLGLPAPEALALEPGAVLTALLQAPAVALFVQRAQEVRPDFRLDPEMAPAVAELCRRLDGLPLAIELAAARSRALPPQAILSRLERRLDLLVGGRRDEPPRHQTVRAALDWSYDLLSPPERALFRRLSVFAGGCSLEAAGAVCNPGPPPGSSEPGAPAEVERRGPRPTRASAASESGRAEAAPASDFERGTAKRATREGVETDGDLPLDTLDGLESLLSKSLLRQDETSGEPRFGMLETVHAFALEALEQAAEADSARQRHAAYYSALAGAAGPALRGPQQMDWLTRLDRERANLRLALQWLTRRAAAGDAAGTAQGLRMGADLWWYWHVRGDYAECLALLMPLLDAPAAGAPGVGRGRALTALAVAAWGLGDYATARARSEAGLALLRELDDAPGAAQALLDVGCAAMSQGSEGDLARAREAFAEALARGRALGEDWIAAWALTFQGTLAIAGGDLPAAGASFEESLAIRRTLGDTFGMAWSRHGLASVARLRGEPARARALYQEALATFRLLGERPTVASILDGLGEVAIALGDFGAARTRFAESLALYREMGSTRGIGIALSGFAALAGAEWRAERAVRLAGAATALHQESGGAIELIRHRGAEDWLQEAREALGAPRADLAWAAGQAMTPDEAVAFALAPPGPPPRPLRPGPPRGPGAALTAREREVATLVAQGASNRHIAGALVISERTAEAHVSHILTKLGLATRVQLAAWAVAHGLADAPDPDPAADLTPTPRP